MPSQFNDCFVDIEQYRLPIDGDDYYPAIMRAQRYFPNQIAPDGTEEVLIENLGMLKFIFRAQEYKFSQTIEILRKVHLCGSGGSASRGGTLFTFSTGKGGLIIHNSRTQTQTTATTALNSDYVDRANLGDLALYGWDDVALAKSATVIEAIDPQGSIIEGIYFRGVTIWATKILPKPADDQYPLNTSEEVTYPANIFPDFRLRHLSGVTALDWNSGSTYVANPYERNHAPSLAAHGIVVYVKTTIRGCTIDSFAGHGLYLFGENNQNNDLCHIANVVISNCNGDGVHIYGSDCGIHQFIGVDANNNTGWGFVYLPNNAVSTLISCHSSYNKKGGYLCATSAFVSPPQPLQKPDLRSNEQRQANEPMPSSVPVSDANLIPPAGILMFGCYAEDNWQYSKFYPTVDGVIQPLVYDDSADIQHDSFLSSTCQVQNCVIGDPAGYPATQKAYGTTIFPQGVTAYSFVPNHLLLPDQPRQYDYAKAILGGGESVLPNIALQFSLLTATNALEESPYSTPTHPRQTINFTVAEKAQYQLIYQDYYLQAGDQQTSSLYTPYKGHWEWVSYAGGASNRTPLRLSTQESDIGPGQIWMENGFYIGSTDDSAIPDFDRKNKRVRVLTTSEQDLKETITGYGSCPGDVPDPTDQTYRIYKRHVWEEGDRLLNKNPTPGGFAGWIYCRSLEDPDVLKWYGYGRIDDTAVAIDPCPVEVP
jgi:hypothetical protein